MENRISIATFLAQDEMAAIKRAVSEAESRTAGEICVLVVQRSLGRFQRRLVLTAREKRALVARRARREFQNQGISRTRGKTGALIMLSLDERIVVVRAGRAINKKVEKGAWQAAVDIIINSIRGGKQGEGICRAVALVGGLLAQHFPRQPDDTNEIPDVVRFGE